MDHGGPDPVALRKALVDGLVAAGRVRSAAVERAFRAVPRHLFLPGVDLDVAYADEAVPTRWDTEGRPTSSSSQPAIMAVMLEQLGLAPGQRVLEIGAGTGYNAALLAELVGPAGAVVTVDIDADLVARAGEHLAAAGVAGVTVGCRDGALGWAEGAPYDRIILTVGAWDLAPAWREQLAPDGRIVLPLSLRGVQRSVAFEPAGDRLDSVSIADCGFMPLRGTMAEPGGSRPLGPAGLFVHVDDDRGLDPAALLRALGRPGDTVPTGLRVRTSEVWGGLALWLALREPALARLSALGPAVGLGLVPDLIAFPGQVGTIALLAGTDLAALARGDHPAGAPEPYELVARGYGPAGRDLADRLAAQVRGWDGAGRPASGELHIRAHPAGTDPSRLTGSIVDKRHTVLELHWTQPTNV